jgi:penicillin-binding protein 1A
MGHALKGVAVQELSPPAGVVQSGGGWTFDEYAQGGGVQSLGLEDTVPAAPSSEERNGILDLFRR